MPERRLGDIDRRFRVAALDQRLRERRGSPVPRDVPARRDAGQRRLEVRARGRKVFAQQMILAARPVQHRNPRGHGLSERLDQVDGIAELEQGADHRLSARFHVSAGWDIRGTQWIEAIELQELDALATRLGSAHVAVVEIREAPDVPAAVTTETDVIRKARLPLGDVAVDLVRAAQTSLTAAARLPHADVVAERVDDREHDLVVARGGVTLDAVDDRDAARGRLEPEARV